MPNTKKSNEEYEAQWAATIKGSVHANDWVAVKHDETFAPSSSDPEPEHPIVEAVQAVAQAAKPTIQVKPAEAKADGKADVKAEATKD